MKQRNLKTFEWHFFPNMQSKLSHKTFKYKKDLMKFLNNNFYEALNGHVELCYDTYNSSGTYKRYFVWFNDYADKNEPIKIKLFRGSKYVFKPSKYMDGEKKWISQANKVCTLMIALDKTEIGTELHKRQMENLIKLFYKAGYKPINLEDYRDEYDYDDYVSLKEPIPYTYWCDRCNFLRCAIIIEVYNKLYKLWKNYTI